MNVTVVAGENPDLGGGYVAETLRHGLRRNGVDVLVSAPGPVESASATAPP